MATTSKTHQHPLRTLIAFLAVTALLYVIMAIGNVWAPKLGLDLRGGTTITLTARNTTGQGQVDAAYRDRATWVRMAAMNTARSGFFSSDRTIRGYMKDVWDVAPAL